MKEVFIVGGGPSLQNFNWSRLLNKDVIAVNRSYEVLPNAKYIYFADWDFYNRHEEAMLNHRGQIITGYAEGICKQRVDHPDVREFKLTGSEGLDIGEGRIRHGRNGGYAAINVAYHLGYKRIYLMGYDMSRIDGKTHWHSGHPRIDAESIYDVMLRHYKTIVEPLQKERIEVYNTFLESKLKEFPFMTIDNAIGDISKCEKVKLDE